MNSTTQYAFVKLAAHPQSPGLSFLAGMLGGPAGAGWYGSRDNNGWNAYGQSASFGNTGRWLGTGAGIGAGVLLGRGAGSRLSSMLPNLEGVAGDFAAGEKPIMNQLRVYNPAAAAKAKQIGALKDALKKITSMGGGVIGGTAGGLVGGRAGYGYGAMRSTKQHNSASPFAEIAYRLKHRN